VSRHHCHAPPPHPRPLFPTPLRHAFLGALAPPHQLPEPCSFRSSFSSSLSPLASLRRFLMRRYNSLPFYPSLLFSPLTNPPFHPIVLSFASSGFLVFVAVTWLSPTAPFVILTLRDGGDSSLSYPAVFPFFRFRPPPRAMFSSFFPSWLTLFPTVGSTIRAPELHCLMSFWHCATFFD